MVVVDIDDHLLQRFETGPGRGVGAVEHARPGNRELVTLAPQGFDQDPELQFAAAANLDPVLAVDRMQVDGDVALGFAE